MNRVDPEYPFVALDAGREGEVIILLYVDVNGLPAKFPSWLQGDNIGVYSFQTHGIEHSANFAIKEEPKGWFFGANLLKVLPQWSFAPRIENGQPVNSLLRIRYRFCLGGDCSRLQVTTIDQ
jgi:hypothetical protein